MEERVEKERQEGVRERERKKERKKEMSQNEPYFLSFPAVNLRPSVVDRV